MENEDKVISTAVIKRLPRYYRYLSELVAQGVERISSNELSEIMHVTASQIRQDLNNFGGFGQQGYGYNVKLLRGKIAELLGIDKPNNLVIVGCGNLGRAIAGYPNFSSRNLFVKGMFDVSSSLIGLKVNDMTIKSMTEIEQFIKDNNISIAVLTVPKNSAIDVAKELYSYGIRAFWNFAHVDLKLPDDAYCENVHLSDSLMQLTYNLNK